MRDEGKQARPLHPQLSPARRAQLIARGATLFDGGRYFAAHECWEEVWRSTAPEPRELWQGLVQLAAAFHHLAVKRRPDVAARVLAKARRRLATPEAAGGPVDLAALRPQIDAWAAWLDRREGEEPPRVRLGPA